ncbi:hypothetical protein C0J45_8835 [Silurus meridionalis]|nr:hypothetical protein C0J45_8835 [Silurus meridionalis]
MVQSECSRVQSEISQESNSLTRLDRKGSDPRGPMAWRVGRFEQLSSDSSGRDLKSLLRSSSKLYLQNTNCSDLQEKLEEHLTPS